MKRAILTGLILAPIALALPIAAVTAQNWDATFLATEGGHRVGNPDAATSMIVFVSYSCPHCASFERESDAGLRAGYIQPGQLKMEVRHVIRNPLDLAAALTTECGAEDKFFANHRAMMRAQPQWLEVAVEATPAQTQRWTSGSIGSRMRAIASDLDFYELMEPRGYSVAQLDQCLTDEAAAQELAERSRNDSLTWEILGTPSFAINGTMVGGVHSWAALQPVLAGSGAGSNSSLDE